VDISRSIFFFPRTHESRDDDFCIWCVCVCDLYVQLESDYRMWHCWPNTQQLYICTVIIRLRPIRIIIIIKPRWFFVRIQMLYTTSPPSGLSSFRYNVTVFIQCLQNTRGSPRFWKWRSSILYFHSLSETNHKIPTYNGSFINCNKNI